MSPDPSTENEVAIVTAVDARSRPAAAQETEEGTSKHVKFSSILVIASVLCLATFCVAVDNTILSTAVPRITHDFHSIDDVGWYAAIYPLMSCAFQPSYGKIYTLFSSKPVFLAALLIFEIGSVICATAPNSHAIIHGRALAGVGSAGIQAGTTLILADRQRRWTLVVIYILIIYESFVAAVDDSPQGGAFSDTTTWRRCFYFNLPIGAAAMIFIALFYDGRRGGRKTSELTGFRSQMARLDLLGTLTFVSVTICLLLALSWGGTTYAWSSARIIALLTVAGILFLLFIGVEYWRGHGAIISLWLLRKRGMCAAIWFGICLGGVFFVDVFYVPLWFQIVDDVPAVRSAILFIPFMLSVVGDFIAAGFGAAVTGYYTPSVYASSIFMSIGTGLLTTVRPQSTSRARWVGFQILCGAGIGLGEEQGLYMVQTALPEAHVATGVGIVLFAQTFGGALLMSVAQAVFLRDISKALQTLAPNLDLHAVLDGASTALPSSSHAQASPELQVIYDVAIKGAL
ncbi:major facilitator superfamily transporter [Phlyctema vagabunda]|uniref:Major facilitator superfamily transporter n=1 Tax=Phlyctema vagabunda TaxID=108571 RepID=A0ABR4P804_9HELO